MFGSFLSCTPVENCICCDPIHKQEIEGANAQASGKETSARKSTQDSIDRHAQVIKMCQDLLKTKGNTKTQVTRHSSWKREPDPMPGWTFEEQRTLIATSRSLQSERAMFLKHLGSAERADWEYLRLIARHLPGKSADDCKRCLAHVKKSKIAYFGSSTRSV